MSLAGTTLGDAEREFALKALRLLMILAGIFIISLFAANL